MSNYTTLLKAVESELLGTYSETPIEFENTNVDESDAPELVSVFIHQAVGEQESTNGSNSIDWGNIIIQIFTPLLKGKFRNDQIADILRALLANKEADKEGASECGMARLFVNNVRKVPAGDGKRYYQQNIEADFIFHYAI